MRKIVRGIDTTNEKKTCSHCGKNFDLTVENFHRNGGAPDGFDHRCKECALEYRREHYILNKESIAEYKKEHYKKMKKEAEEKKALINDIKEYAKTMIDADFEDIDFDTLINIEYDLYYNIIDKIEADIAYYVNNKKVSEIEFKEWLDE